MRPILAAALIALLALAAPLRPAQAAGPPAHPGTLLAKTHDGLTKVQRRGGGGGAYRGGGSRGGAYRGGGRAYRGSAPRRAASRGTARAPRNRAAYARPYRGRAANTPGYARRPASRRAPPRNRSGTNRVAPRGRYAYRGGPNNAAYAYRPGRDARRRAAYSRPHGRNPRHYRKGRWYNGYPRWRGDRRYYRGYYWRPAYDGWYYWYDNAWLWAPALGAVVAAATIPAYTGTTVVVVQPYEPWSDEWYAYCANRYRSFDPQTGTFLAYSGVRKFCVYRG